MVGSFEKKSTWLFINLVCVDDLEPDGGKNNYCVYR